MPLSATADMTIVETTAGRVAGTGYDVKVFKGIPFAAPPVGDLRWRPPAPVTPWTGTRPAIEFAPDCPQQFQPNLGTVSRAPRRDEDNCLTLNVWTPATTSNDKLPVMVWVYGGSFLFGSGSDARFDGESFARKGVILVTFNYRTGLFGFLAHPELTKESPVGSSGNYALFDTLAALRWVKDNIAAFGGDAERVTLFGVSAGGAIVSLLMTSPLSKGLFQQAILESPGSYRTLADLTTAEEAGRVLGDDIKALRKLTANELLARERLLVPPTRSLTKARILRPILDGHVIPTLDREAFSTGAFMKIPAIIGTNADEGQKLTASWPLDVPEEREKIIDRDYAGHGDAVRNLYATTNAVSARASVAEMFADAQFNYGAWAFSRQSARHQPKTFRYLFTRRRPGATRGPDHGDEIYYVFNSLAIPPIGETIAKYDKIDERVANAMQNAWVRFAKTGDPNGDLLPPWPAYNAAADEMLEFGDDIRTVRNWRVPQMKFLDSFFAQSQSA